MYGLSILQIPLALLLEDPATKFKPSDPPINRSDSLAGLKWREGKLISSLPPRLILELFRLP